MTIPFHCDQCPIHLPSHKFVNDKIEQQRDKTCSKRLMSQKLDVQA